MSGWLSGAIEKLAVPSRNISVILETPPLPHASVRSTLWIAGWKAKIKGDAVS